MVLMEVNSYLFKFLDLSLLEHGEHVGRGPLSTFCTAFLLLGLPAGLKRSDNTKTFNGMGRNIVLNYTNNSQNPFYHLPPTLMLLSKRLCRIMVENPSLNIAAVGERERLRMSH